MPHSSLRLAIAPISWITLHALALNTTALAQAPNVNDLLSDEWRVRNAAAVRLIKHPETSNKDLLRVLETQWQGQLPTPGMGAGGRYGSKDPRQQTLSSAWIEVGHNWPITTPMHPKTIGELVAPWHPHKLATLVLLERGKADGLQDLEPTDTTRARIWLACCKPSSEQIAEALTTAATAQAVLFAHLPQAKDKRQLLFDFMANGPPPARRAAFRMAGDLPLERAQLLGAIEQLLHDDDEAYTRNAAHQLVRSKAPAAELLAKHLGKNRSDRQRALALLCVMDEHAKPAAAELIACLRYDVTSQRRALVALSNFAIPADLQQQAASEILALLEKTRSRIVRVLAADALARCGHGITAEQRTRLQAMLQERKFRVMHARLLGTLRKLDAVPDLELDVQAKLAKSIYFEAEAWATLADRGEVAVPTIIEHKLFGPLVGARLAETAPKTLVAWLDSDDPAMQTTALAGLLDQRPDLIASDQLAAMLAKQSKLADRAFDALCQRKDASQHVAALLEFARNRSWLDSQQVAHVRRLAPSFSVLADTFQEKLRAGNAWNVVRGIDDEQLRMLARQWLKETDDGRTRDSLLAELVKLGLSKGQDIQMVEQALRAPERSNILSVLSDADFVPPQLIPALEAVCDAKPANKFSNENWNAREALITAHR